MYQWLQFHPWCLLSSPPCWTDRDLHLTVHLHCCPPAATSPDGLQDQQVERVWPADTRWTSWTVDGGNQPGFWVQSHISVALWGPLPLSGVLLIISQHKLKSTFNTQNFQQWDFLILLKTFQTSFQLLFFIFSGLERQQILSECYIYLDNILSCKTELNPLLKSSTSEKLQVCVLEIRSGSLENQVSLGYQVLLHSSINSTTNSVVMTWCQYTAS